MAFSIDQFRLDGKVVIITGAGGRGNSIGRAYALGFAGAGASVVVADLNEEGAKAVADEIVAGGGKAVAVKVNVADRDSTLAMAQAAVEAFGGIDILVNNAALMAELGQLTIADVGLEEWNRILSVNLTGAMLCAQSVIPAMRERGGGRILNQTSGGAFPATGIYGIGKLALVGLTTTLAKQLGKENITCNAIAPGNVKSDAGKMLVPDDSPFIQYLQMSCATRARGEPDELVGTALLLCSEAGAWITGQVIHIDGGWVMRP
ncbi:SDR family oxidoreductase [Novosphingobium flavum]|jgi:NAD(P)-dependent dehydrogenase (short-subunit alcohol dehydrogenase family)|uniref:SDR family oxidoreductase n=1 Tax=Novosphingobium aerophilum TaxID=2839843 RepID=A0A7X1F9U5_9SPHN|nr:SDR family oxidoreductase [Novosphingobium aerophilum]MBC2653055.1 SDR family oxidoreductase [Novosphingobium aerophilum]MBC2663240.1 SDR family oxidoreductase [Novosphingobium aerophilum]